MYRSSIAIIGLIYFFSEKHTFIMPPFSFPSLNPIEYVDNSSDDYDDEDADPADALFDHDIRFLDEERVDGAYYLGGFTYDPELSDHLLLDRPISLTLFYLFELEDLHGFTNVSSVRILQYYKRPIQITTSTGNVVEFDEHCVLDKTYWLRVFQRNFRKHLHQQRQNVNACMIAKNWTQYLAM